MKKSFVLANIVLLLFSLFGGGTGMAADKPSYVTVTSFAKQLSGDNLTAIFSLSGIPPTLSFNRSAAPDGGLEYAWRVNIYASGNMTQPDYQLVAAYLKGFDVAPISTPLETSVKADVRKHNGNGVYSVFGTATLAVDYQANTLTLIGTVPGVSNSGVIICPETYDLNPGGQSVMTSGCQPVAPVNTPESFSFTPVTDAQPGSTVESNAITVKGITTAARIEVQGGESSIDYGPYSPYPAGISNGQTVRVRTTASSTPGARKDIIVTIGGISATFSVTTTTNIVSVPTTSNSNVERFFRWAEYRYDYAFSPAKVASQKYEGYTYCFYPYTGTYLAVRDADSLIFATGGLFGQQIYSAGKLSDWTGKMTQDGYLP